MKKSFLVLFVLFITNGIFAQWTEISNLSFPLKDICFESVTSVYVAGDSGVYHSLDAGYTWNEISIFDSVGDEDQYDSSSFTGLHKEGDNWFATGYNFENDRAVIFKMNTADLIWKLVFEGDPGSKLNCISGESGIVTAAGNNNLVCRTIDPMGETWGLVSTGHPYDWTSIAGNDHLSGEEKVIMEMGGSWTEMATAESEIKDILFTSGDQFMLTNDFIFTGPTFSFKRSGYMGVLNANCITRFEPGTNQTLIGTDDGIYMSTTVANYEWGRFPSTFGYEVNEIYYDETVLDEVYAICENGAVLLLGLTYEYMPYTAFVQESGGCVDSVFTFEILSYSTDYYDWYLDGVWVGDDGSDLEITIPGPAGWHEMKLTRWSGGMDSAIINFYVSELPDLSETLIYTDSIFCKNGSTEVTVSAGLSGFDYTLHDINAGTVLYQSDGSDTDLILPTGILNDSTFLMVEVGNILSNCRTFFPDSFSVIIDNPKANFKPIPINAVPNENIYFNNLSHNAIQYEWSFLDIDADILSSTVENPNNFYSDTGLKTIQLVAESENECTDTVVLSNISCYNPESLKETCWIHHFGDTALGINHVDHYSFNDFPAEMAIDNSDNIYVSAGSNYHSAPTKAGLEEYFPGSHCYLNKYSPEGVLKWSSAIVSVPSRPAGIRSMVVDDENNLIVSIDVHESFILICPNGDTLSRSTIYSDYDLSLIGYKDAIVKFDSLGNVLWSGFFASQMLTLGTTEICVDSSNNIYSVTSQKMPNDGMDIFIEGDGDFVYCDDLWSAGSLVAKWSPEGEILWQVPITGPDINNAAFVRPEVTCAADGTLFIGAVFENDMTIRATDGDHFVPSAVNSTHAAIVSLSEEGEFLWSSEIYSEELSTGYFNNVALWAIAYDDVHESLYFTTLGGNGTSDVTFGTNSTPSSDTVMTLPTVSVIGKYDKTGNLKWVNYGDLDYCRFKSIGLDDDGFVYVGGNMSRLEFAAWDYLIFTSTDDDGLWVYRRDASLFINKYNSDGVILNSFYECTEDEWIGGISGLSDPVKIEIDSESNIYSYYTGVGSEYDVFPFASEYTLEVTANLLAKFTQSGCGASTIGLDEEISNWDVSIFPNPTTGLIYINTNENVRVCNVYNLNGQLLISQGIEGEGTIDLGNLVTGMYVLEIISDKGTILEKVIKY